MFFTLSSRRRSWHTPKTLAHVPPVDPPAAAPPSLLWNHLYQVHTSKTEANLFILDNCIILFSLSLFVCFFFLNECGLLCSRTIGNRPPGDFLRRLSRFLRSVLLPVERRQVRLSKSFWFASKHALSQVFHSVSTALSSEKNNNNNKKRLIRSCSASPRLQIWSHHENKKRIWLYLQNRPRWREVSWLFGPDRARISSCLNNLNKKTRRRISPHSGENDCFDSPCAAYLNTPAGARTVGHWGRGSEQLPPDAHSRDPAETESCPPKPMFTFLVWDPDQKSSNPVRSNPSRFF